jgi:predicted nucleotidyltransferase
MRPEQVIAILRAHRPQLDAMGVRSLALFGSTVRGEAGPDSDVDLLVEFTHPVGLFELVELQQQLEGWLQHTVDLVPRDSLKKQLEDDILAEAIRAA